MKELVENFPLQLQEALTIGKQASFHKPKKEIRNILITGLGGSGIGGTIVSELVQGECPVPILVNKDYFIPSFVNEQTLVIVSSYSGNTEETIMAMKAAVEKKSTIACITSGGTIAAMAAEHGCNLVLIPGGMPPRSCLGYSMTQLFFILHHYGFISGNFKPQLEAAIRLIQSEKENIQKEASDIAEKLHNKIPVIYAVDGFNGTATRFRQQINENSKMLCWHHILPEMNHNELVGWAEKHPECVAVFLRSKDDFIRTQKRIEISRDVVSKLASSVIEVWSKGASALERTVYLVHLTDWVSCYLADMKNIDADEVNVINYLKGSLAKL